MAKTKPEDYKVELYAGLSAACLLSLLSILTYKLQFLWFFSERIRVTYLLLPRTWSALNALGTVEGYNFGIICALHLGLLIVITGVLREVLARHIYTEIGLRSWLHCAIAPGVNVALEIIGVFPFIIVDAIANPERFSLLKAISGIWGNFIGLAYISGTMSQLSGLGMLMGDNGLYVLGFIQMLALGLIFGLCVDGFRYILKRALGQRDQV